MERRSIIGGLLGAAIAAITEMRGTSAHKGNGRKCAHCHGDGNCDKKAGLVCSPKRGICCPSANTCRGECFARCRDGFEKICNADGSVTCRCEKPKLCGTRSYTNVKACLG
jgi:hypothetical protein